ncbi:hypothetical protein CW736_12655 [Nonlabens sp. MB-3u-79]|nr:hypothetical protein CW736_12655 [Nonlabens sp. MB-3u-79]
MWDEVFFARSLCSLDIIKKLLFHFEKGAFLFYFPKGRINSTLWDTLCNIFFKLDSIQTMPT